MTQRERQEHAKKTIFQAALAEFGAQPYETVTMDRICSRHGISKGMELRRPVREMNRRFLQEVIAEMSLRPAVKAEHAARYLESLECVFRRILEQYCAKDDPKDARSMLAAAEEVLDMLLLGILKR